LDEQRQGNLARDCEGGIMSQSCAICEAEDLFDFGMCASCATTGKDWRLLMVQPPADPGAQRTVELSLRHWLSQTDERAIEAVTRGQRILAALPATMSDAARRTLERAGIPTRSLPTRQWYHTLPAPFGMMLIGMVVTGLLAGMRAAPVLLWTTPLMLVLLVIAAWQEVKRPLWQFTRTHATLPASARDALATALQRLPVGGSRELLLDLARVGESTYTSLSAAFRRASLGESVVELIIEASRLSVETDQLETVALELQLAGVDRGQDTSALEQAVATRVNLLQRALLLLARIAKEGSHSSEAEMARLIEQLRTEADWRVQGEAAVESLLRRKP
jgi:hypothetical protein